MILTERKEPMELLYYRALKKRCLLTDKEKRSLSFYEKGYSGECLYDEILEEVEHENLYVFRDIWLEINSGIVQLDNLIISDGEMIINEIKYYT